MENASKALIMAGGVFIAIFVLGALVYMWVNLGEYNTQVYDSKKTQQVAEFNAQYESYAKQILRGNDIASIINKIKNNNDKYEDRPITWEFKLVENISGLNKGTYNASNYSSYENMTKNKSNFDDFKALFFVCSLTEYNSNTGYISKMVFLQKTYSELF